MKTNQKQLKLIQYGLKPSTVTKLTESQVDIFYSKLLSEQQVQPQIVNKNVKQVVLPPGSQTTVGGISVSNIGGKTTVTPTTESEIDEDMDSQMDWLMKGDTQDPIQKGPSTDDGFDDYSDGTDEELDELHEELKNIYEKFESKKQQKYFFYKCGEGKTKEQKKWCKMADEFAKKTNFKKLPEKKKEVKESGMSNYYKKVASAFAGGIKNKLNNIPINPTFGENKIEKNIMKLVEKHITPKMTKKEFLNLVKEGDTQTAPVKPVVIPGTPTKPEKPITPYKPKPNVKPRPKAGTKTAPAKPVVIPGTPTKPEKPMTPYQPKPGVKTRPKAGKKMPKWLSFNEIGINIK